MNDKLDSTADSEANPAANAKQDPLNQEPLKHIVTIMFENRSFDNLMGYLYGTDDSPVPHGQTFDGLLTGREPYWNPGMDGEPINAHPYVPFNDLDPDGEGLKTAANSPDPDPGEEYQHVNVQLYGEFIPPENADKHTLDMLPPYNLPENAKATMKGFVKDYYHGIFNNNGNDKEDALKKCPQIMGSFTLRQLPVLSTLAREFAVYDRWFSAVPTQTFANRAFFHASTSSGYVTNLGNRNPDHAGKLDPEKWIEENPALTIFNLLERAGISWAIYYDKTQKTSITKMINFWAFEQLPPSHEKNIRTMEQFYDDVEKGNLPAYSFIEPRGFFNHNDMHPPLTINWKGEAVNDPSDVRDGEQLLHEVYMAIRNSSSSADMLQSNATNTTLLITFDEHGGTYDHVPPPAAKPPSFPPGTIKECGFNFDRLGLRVPTIVVSCLTKRQTVINDRMHHGSLIATLCRKYKFDSLTERDEGAPDIGNAFNLPWFEPRWPDDWPVTQPNPVTPKQHEGPFTGDIALTPLTSPARSQAALLVAKYGEPGEKVPENYGEAYEMLERVGKILGR